MPDPSDSCFLAPFQGLTITRVLQPNGLHPIDRPALHRASEEYELFEADVASFYPSVMVRFGIWPGAL
ncbi:MAG TPA: hypothetical protein VKP69_33150, partial [Isosphaeraceae bacterium]|nr:hypothetical protein [Isosphaeraceae bacterium]